MVWALPVHPVLNKFGDVPDDLGKDLSQDSTAPLGKIDPDALSVYWLRETAIAAGHQRCSIRCLLKDEACRSGVTAHAIFRIAKLQTASPLSVVTLNS